MRKGLLAFAFAVSLGLLGCGGGGGTIIVPPGLADNVILYYVFDSGGALYTIKSDGTDKALVSNGEFASLVVNPARTAIAFTRKVGNFNHIFTMNVNGTGLTQVTTDDHNHDNPSFDQTGSILYFDRDMDGTGINDRKIVRWGLISGVMTQLTFADSPPDTLPHDFEPAISPNGQIVAFFRSPAGGNGYICTMSSDGNGITQIAPLGTEDPKWSPDGTKIAYIDNQSALTSKIMIMDADGGNKTQVTSDSSRFADISWSPDGTQIGYTHRSAATSFIAQLYTINIDGTNKTKISVDANLDHGFLAWSTQ